MSQKGYLAGILGGLGPQAGVYFQQLIIDVAEGETDQDHARVLCYTNPTIPDRNKALLGDGQDYIPELINSLQVLEKAGVSELFIACMTAHHAIPAVTENIKIPVFNAVEETHRFLRQNYKGEKISLFATKTVHRIKLFEVNDLMLYAYSEETQDRIMDIIYLVKSGNISSAQQSFSKIIEEANERGIYTHILGCTELSLLLPYLSSERNSYIDPLRLMAKYIVQQNKKQTPG